MVLEISILKKIIDCKCMYIEKIGEGTTTYQAYGKTYVQPSIIITARPHRKDQLRCPVFITSVQFLS